MMRLNLATNTPSSSLGGVAAADDEFRFVAIGANAKGIIAIGTLAQGIVAIGVNAVGVVAIGLNAMGTVFALGLNAIAPVAISAVNSIGLLSLSAVNAIGGFGYGLVNELVHPVLGLLCLIAMVAVGFRLRGRWRQPDLPPLVPPAALVAGREKQGWAQARLLAVDERGLVVGDDDGEIALKAPAKVRSYAEELLVKARPRVLVHVEVADEMGEPAAGDYRAAAERTAVLHTDELRRWPSRGLGPQDVEELRWIWARCLWLMAVVGCGLSIYWAWL